MRRPCKGVVGLLVLDDMCCLSCKNQGRGRNNLILMALPNIYAPATFKIKRQDP